MSSGNGEKGFIAITFAVIEVLLRPGHEAALRVWLALALEADFKSGQNRRSSFRTLRKRHGIGLKAIGRGISILERLGLLQVERRGVRRRSFYRLLGLASVTLGATDQAVSHKDTDLELLPPGVQAVTRMDTDLYPVGTTTDQKTESPSGDSVSLPRVPAPVGAVPAEVLDWLKAQFPSVDVDKQLEKALAWRGCHKMRKSLKDFLFSWMEKQARGFTKGGTHVRSDSRRPATEPVALKRSASSWDK